MQYRYDIQGLRAVAVLLVFFFHLNPNLLSGGFVGVDVFFVISGYLISGIILHKKEQNKFQFVDFYISRFKRILPAYVIFLLVTFLGAIMLYLPSDVQPRKPSFTHMDTCDRNAVLFSASHTAIFYKK